MVLVAAEFTVSTTFMVFAILAIVAQSILLLVALFGRGPKYKVAVSDLRDINPDDFVRTLEAVTDARKTSDNRIEVCANGENFYVAELEAIRQARHTINLEAYIFNTGVVTERFTKALAERARA